MDKSNATLSNLCARARQRERWRHYAQQRQRQLSAEQREMHLARRRDNYRLRKQSMQRSGFSQQHSMTNTTTHMLPEVTNIIPNTLLHDSTDTAHPQRMRLTTVRRMARTVNAESSHANFEGNMK